MPFQNLDCVNLNYANFQTPTLGLYCKLPVLNPISEIVYCQVVLSYQSSGYDLDIANECLDIHLLQMSVAATTCGWITFKLVTPTKDRSKLWIHYTIFKEKLS